MIRDSLAIVVVARRHPERLPETLAAIAADTVPGTVIVMNLTGDVLDLPGRTVITAASTMSLSHAVDRAISEISADAVWVLRDDTVPRPGAFAALASVFDTSPSVGIVGPKQMDALSPVTIREMGESMTRTGFAVHLAERELDQAQYDRTSDVLAVGEAGMLVRRELWQSLGGFDPALPGVDGALDFCYRARSSGWRVEVIPAAVIDTAVTSLQALAGELSEARVVMEEARSRAHRVLVYGSSFVQPLIAIGLVIGTFVKGLGRFTQKRSSPFAEWRGTVTGVVDIGAVGRARRAFRAIRTNPIGGSRLFVSPAELRHRRALDNDERRALLEATDDSPRLTFGATALWWTGFAVVAGLVLNGRLLGAPALAGGALLPMPGTISEAWAAIGATWSDVAAGITAVPDGFAALMGLLATLTWWQPNAGVIALFVAAIPLSFVAGYIGAGALTTNSRAAVIVGAGWALIPTLHIAVAEGRITAVLAHLALPLFARAIAGTTIVSLGWASILGAVVWVSVPALAPVVVLAVIIRAMTGNPGAIAALLPAVAFEWPRLVTVLGNPLSYFADRGVPFPVSSPTGILSLTLWPGTPTIPLVSGDVAALISLALVAGLFALTVIAVLVADNPRVGAVLTMGGLALVTWFAVGPLKLASADGETVGLFPGSLFDVVWFGLIVGAAITISATRIGSSVLAPTSIIAFALVGVTPLTAGLAGTSLVNPTTIRTLPAYVEAETAVRPGGATLIVTPSPDGLRAELQRDSGVTLVDWTAAAATRIGPAENEPAVAEIAANLIVESGFDVVSALEKNDIRFVLLEAPPTATEVSSIASHSGLTSVGVTDRGILWRVTGDGAAAAIDRKTDTIYIAVLGAVLVVALVAAVPTTLPRRRPVADDVIPLTEEDDDEHS